MRSTAGLALICLFLVPRPTLAQTEPPGVLFSWGTINLALAPDTAEGLRLLSATTPRAGPAVGERSFGVSFIPDSAERWAVAAESLLAHAPDTGWTATTALLGHGGSGILLALHRQRAGGEVERILVFIGRGNKAVFRVTLTGNTASEFVRGMREQALQARWVPPRPKVDSTGLATAVDTSAVQRPPSFLRGPALTYPEVLRQQGLTGAVWARFILDTAGHPDLSTLRVIYSNSPEFSAAVRTWAKGARFEPAAINGRPIRALVEMPFTFTLN